MVTVTSFEHIGHQVSTKPNQSHSTTSSQTSFAKTLHQSTSKEHETTVVHNQQPVTKTKDADVVEDKVSEGEKNSMLTLDFLLSTAKVAEESKTEENVDFSLLFQATSVDELVNALGGKALPEGEQLTLGSLAEALGMTETDLHQLISKLTGNEQQAMNVWDALNQIDQNVFPILQQLAASINGHSQSNLSAKEAQQAVSFLKLVELAAPKTDLLLSQQLQTSQTKDWLANLASQITAKTVEKEVTLPFAKTTMRFQPLTTENTQTSNVTAQQSVAVNKTQTFTIQLPANATPQSQSAKFVEEFQSVMNRAQFANNAAGTRLLIKLYPENLGTIRIELVQRDGILSAKILASNALGKQMLDSTLAQLKQGFSNQNIQVDRIDIAQALSEPSKGERQFNQQQSNSQQAFKDDEQAKDTDDMMSFEELLNGLEE
ncbi:MAG: flagellar hook-length control protein FliK [Kurthia sp.]|nr:flagellar hook-length control protein FliK [Candidatus Kurthia equi]